MDYGCSTPFNSSYPLVSTAYNCTNACFVRFLILFFEHPIDEPPPFWGPKSKPKRKAASDEKNENDWVSYRKN
jgi:hypothetical protein